jgi:hypothetical protein
MFVGVFRYAISMVLLCCRDIRYHKNSLWFLVLVQFSFSQIWSEHDQIGTQNEFIHNKNYIGYTSGRILTQGVSYRRWLNNRLGAQVTVGLPQQSDPEELEGDTTVYDRTNSGGLTGIIQIYHLQNLRSIGLMNISLIHLKSEKSSRYMPLPGVGFGLEFYLWRFCTMAALNVAPPFGSSAPLFLDFGIYFMF